MEMEIFNHYNEVLSVLHYLFRYIFNGLEERYAAELSVIRQQYPSEPALITEKPLTIHWHDAMDMLESTGLVPNRHDDLSGQDELLLGKLVREKYKSDFFALDQYPAAVRYHVTAERSSTNLLST
jgi:aspartyl-tRNA synthetase